MWEMRKAYNILVVKPERQRLLRMLTRLCGVITHKTTPAFSLQYLF
jgi:hypothetical protein